MGSPGGLELVDVDLTIAGGVGGIEAWLGLIEVALALILRNVVIGAHAVNEVRDLGPGDGARVVSVQVVDELLPDFVGVLLGLSQNLESEVDAVLGGLSLELGNIDGAVTVEVAPFELGLKIVLGRLALLSSGTVLSALSVNVGLELGPLNSARAISVNMLEDLSPNLVGIALGLRLELNEGALSLGLGHGGSHRLHAWRLQP